MADADIALAELGRATVMGRGLGAYVALLMAGARPDAVRGAILRDGSGLAGGGPRPSTPVMASVDPEAVAPPDPFAIAELARDVRPPDYASSFARQAAQLSGLERPISVCAIGRPDWLRAVLEEPGVEESGVSEALTTYARSEAERDAGPRRARHREFTAESYQPPRRPPPPPPPPSRRRPNRHRRSRRGRRRHRSRHRHRAAHRRHHRRRRRDGPALRSPAGCGRRSPSRRGTDRCIGSRLVHFDESEAPRAARLPVIDERDRRDASVSLEEPTDLVLRSTEGKVAYVDFLPKTTSPEPAPTVGHPLAASAPAHPAPGKRHEFRP